MMDFNYIDYVILAILLLSIIAGLLRGFVREVIALITWIAAFVVASMYATPLASAFTKTPPQSLSLLSVSVSFVVIFIVILLLGMLISYIISSLVELGGISFFNRLLGALFGLARGFLVVLLLILLVQMTAYSKEELWQNSRFVNAFQPSVKWLEDTINPHFEELKATAIEQFTSKEEPAPVKKKEIKVKKVEELNTE